MTHEENNQEASKVLGERGSLKGIRSLVSIVEIITPPWLHTIFCLGKTSLSYAMNLRTALPFATLAILENMAGVSPKRAFKNWLMIEVLSSAGGWVLVFGAIVLLLKKLRTSDGQMVHTGLMDFVAKHARCKQAGVYGKAGLKRTLRS
jgi:hypothetical protein